MSINHISQDLPETLWWPNSQNHHDHHLHHHHQQQPFMDIPSSSPSKPHHHQFSTAPWTFHHGHNSTTLNFNLNREDEDDLDEQVIDGGGVGVGVGHSHGEGRGLPSELDKEVLFEKPLTPSDVGKLNRLVIPKQHAEKYFPLGGDSVDKGLLLSFEDESGKFWRFRYSYWSSSQSYVLTKGWSRYVKEKRLDAGDVVFFERHRANGERIFIGWRRRGAAAAAQEGGRGGDGWGRRRALYSDSEHHHHHHPQQPHHHPNYAYPTHQGDDGPPMPYRPDCPHAGSDGRRPGNSKGLLRLFGVNMEYQVEEPEISTSEGSTLSPTHHHPSQHHQFLF